MISITSENSISHITFQITEACNCDCSYCYQLYKSNNTMTKDIADQAINFLFSQKDKISDMLTFTFVGGEPFLNIEIIDYICSIFLERCMKEKSIWALNWAVDMTTNSLCYFNDDVQNFIKKYKPWIRINISLDGIKEAHDTCRKTCAGTGSFDKSWAALNHYRDNYDKEVYAPMVVCPENLQYVGESLKFLFEHGFTTQPNIVYEHRWTFKEANIYYHELIKVADYCCDNNIECNNLFNENYYVPIKEEHLENWCGGNGGTLAIDPRGFLYPCIRFTPSALGENQNPMIIGDVKNGFYQGPDFDLLKCQICGLNRRNQTTNECFYCPIAAGCPWCPAYDYHCTGNFHERNTNICAMYSAQAAANHYYWTKKGKTKHLFLPKEKCLQIMTEDEYRRLINGNYNS